MALCPRQGTSAQVLGLFGRKAGNTWLRPLRRGLECHALVVGCDPVAGLGAGQWGAGVEGDAGVKTGWQRGLGVALARDGG